MSLFCDESWSWIKMWIRYNHIMSGFYEVECINNEFIYLYICFTYQLLINTYYKWVLCFNFNILYNFTMYPTHSGVGRGNLVLTHSVPQFPPNFIVFACWVVEINALLCHDIRTKIWKYNICLFFEMESNKQPVAFTLSLWIKNIYF